MNPLLVSFIVLDLIVTAAVVVTVLKLRGGAWAVSWRDAPSIVSIEQMRGLEAFSREQHEYIGETMRANWSGIPDQLPPVLTALLDELERRGRAKGLPLDRAALKVMLAASLRSHRIGRGRERDEAFKLVA